MVNSWLYFEQHFCFHLIVNLDVSLFVAIGIVYLYFLTTEVKKYADKLCEMLLLFDKYWSCHDTVETKMKNFDHDHAGCARDIFENIVIMLF